MEDTSPRYVNTCRARVWQEAWDPMPWDHCRRTVETETRGQTYSSAEEKERNWRDAKLDRYRQYQVHFYGSPKEKESKNSHLRTHLKQQLESVEPPQKLFVKRVAESKAVGEKARLEELEENERHLRHRKFLSGFKDKNKMMIDAHLRVRRKHRLSELEEEQKRLRLNPINWNRTLW